MLAVLSCCIWTYIAPGQFWITALCSRADPGSKLLDMEWCPLNSSTVTIIEKLKEAFKSDEWLGHQLRSRTDSHFF